MATDRREPLTECGCRRILTSVRCKVVVHHERGT
jgi:hypothetical protein